MPTPNTVFMFSGQGSQYFQMGRSLYERERVFRNWMDRMDAIALEQTGCSVVSALYDPKRSLGDLFDRTLLTHPAIFMVEYALAAVLIENGIRPDLTLGASLGSFAAATVSGCVTMEDALTAVIGQARILEKHCSRGAMTAILGDPRLLEEPPLKDNCDLAAHNFPNHFVVSARTQSLAEIESFLSSTAITFQRLPVSFAFHSRWIEEASAPSREHLGRLSLARAQIPLACCASADVLQCLPTDYFWRVARTPIEFQKTIAALEQHGAHRYIDVGPAGTLATFLKYLLPPTSASSVYATLTRFGRDAENIAAIAATH